MASVSSIFNFLSNSKAKALWVLDKLILQNNRVYSAKVSSQFALQSFCTHSNISMVIQTGKMN